VTKLYEIGPLRLDARMPDAAWDAIYLLELDNVRGALDRALGAGGDPTIATILAGASGPIWTNLLLRREGRQRLEDAVARIGFQRPEPNQARLWLWLRVLWGAAAPAHALAGIERAVDLYRRLGDAWGLGYSLVQLGHRLALMGRCEHAARALAEAAPLLEHASAPRTFANYFDALGFLKMSIGDPAGAGRTMRKHCRYAAAWAPSAWRSSC
jgi:hypothetical protein